MTELEHAIKHIKTRADAWAVNEVTEALQSISERMDKALSQECVEPTQKHVGNTLDMRCNDLIEREAVLNAICDYVAFEEYEDKSHTFTIRPLTKRIKQLPPVIRQTECLKVQAKKQAMPMSCDDCCYEPNSPFCEMYRKDICEKKDERQSGKWIDYSDEGYVECPFCGHATTCEDNIDELHYCFYCGAKMESEVRDEVNH
jgi:hypothetical protein